VVAHRLRIQDAKGSPLPAVLYVSGQAIQANENGILIVPIGTGEDVEISCKGYITQEWSIVDLQQLETLILTAEIIEMVVEDEEKISHPAYHRLDRNQVERTPGTYNDPIRLIQSLPGVAQTREYGPSAGDIILRAAKPTESVILIDGIALPYLYHFQQYASVIHTRLLDSVDMYASGYGVSYGNAAGGVVAVNTRQFRGDETMYAVNGNMIMAGGFYSQKIGDGRITVSGRRSHADLYTSGNDQYSVWPVFGEYLLRYDHVISAQTAMSVTAIGATDQYHRYAFDSEALDPFLQTENPNFIYDRGFHAGMLRLMHTSERLYSKNVLGVVNDQWDGSISGARQERNERYLYLRSDSQWLFREDLSLSVGLEGKGSLLSIFCNAQNPWFSLAGEAPYLEDGVPVERELMGGFLAAWSELRYQGALFSAYPGLRFQHNTGGETNIDPRLTLQLTPENWSFRLGGGRYTQLPTIESRLEQAIYSHQLSAGIDMKHWDHWDLSFDLWGREIFEREDGENGWAMGSELFLNYHPHQNIFSWFSLQLAHSSAQEQYLQPFALNFVLSWKITPNIDFGLRYRYSSGMPYIPPVGSRYISQEDRYIPILDSSASAALPDYQKIDIHIAKGWEIAEHKVITYAEIWYVPPQANYLYPVYNFNFTEEKLVVGPPIVPLLGIRVEN